MGNSRFDQLPLEWVRAFEAAARLGSFTAAATETGLTQPAISQRIAHLEARLGAKLFLREARQVGLTSEGETWLPHVQAALTGLRDSSEALFGVAQNQLVISASASITNLWLIPRMEQLQRETGAQISLRTMVVSSDLAREDNVIQIRYGAGDWATHYKAPLFDEVMCPVAAPSLVANGLDPQDLPRISVAGPRPGWSEWCERHGWPLTPVPSLRVDTLAAGVLAAQAGLGVLLASRALVVEDLGKGRLVTVTDQIQPHHETYWLLARKERMSRTQWSRLRACLVDR